MTDRIKLTQDVVMNLDGQTTVVLSGSVIDVLDKTKFSSSHYVDIAETAGALAKSIHPTAVRNVRRK